MDRNNFRREMNREILFRGKRVDNGAWETGSLVKERMWTSEERVFIADKMTGYHTPVIPSTVGQYTGLTDRNGRRIFEGDILSGHLDELFPEEETRLVVEWHETGFYGRNSQGQHDGFENGFQKHFTVIGNIHDNPELLEK